MSSAHNAELKEPRRAYAYIDGFNLYFGIKSLQKPQYKWLNLQRLAEELLWNQYGKSARLIHTHYFTSLIEDNDDKVRRQRVFLTALRTLSDFSIHYGVYHQNERICPNCGASYSIYREKKSDVNLASQLLWDAFRGKFDIALIISRDSDLVPAVEVIKAERLGEICFAFPPGKRQLMVDELKGLCTRFQRINGRLLEKCLFDEEIILPSGDVIRRPPEWDPPVELQL